LKLEYVRVPEVFETVTRDVEDGCGFAGRYGDVTLTPNISQEFVGVVLTVEAEFLTAVEEVLPEEQAVIVRAAQSTAILAAGEVTEFHTFAPQSFEEQLEVFFIDTWGEVVVVVGECDERIAFVLCGFVIAPDGPSASAVRKASEAFTAG